MSHFSGDFCNLFNACQAYWFSRVSLIAIPSSGRTDSAPARQAGGSTLVAIFQRSIDLSRFAADGCFHVATELGC